MNLYNYIIEIVDNYKKDSLILKEYYDIKNEIKELKNDFTYSLFFQLADSYVNNYFYAPNIALQIYNQKHQKKEGYEFLSEENCKRVISNETIKKYVELSTKLNQDIFREINKMLSPFDIPKNSKDNYLYNKFYDELGYLGFGKVLSNYVCCKKDIDDYILERNKYIKEGEFIFPYKIISIDYFSNKLVENNRNNIFNSFESINMILSIINILFYAILDNKIIFLEKNDIKILKTKNKSNVKTIKFTTSNIDFLFGFPLIIKIDDDIFFTQETSIQLGKTNETTCKCIKIDFSERESLAIFSVLDLSKI